MGLLFVCVITTALLLFYSAEAVANKKSYIVLMNLFAKPDSFDTHAEWYTDVVSQSLTDQSSPSAAENYILYTYNNSFHGFAVAMSAEEAQSLRQSNSVVQVYEDKQYFLHTTHTPKFLGLEEHDLWPDHTLGDLDKASQNVIIGVLDTGVWPESDSFRDESMSEVPTRWRGKCAPGFNHCNKKLIGARSFLKGYQNAMGKSKESESPRDYEGHGTHTASTAAGTEARNASLLK